MPADAPPVTRLADLTTLRVGGPARRYVAATSEAELVSEVAGADRRGEPLLMIGCGSNMVVGDAGFDGLVLHDARAVEGPVFSPNDDGGAPGISRREILGQGDDGDFPKDDDDENVLATVPAGYGWDRLVADCVAAGLAGIEAMSGIPGTVGAAPVQNIGAYGQDVSMTFHATRAFDRGLAEIVHLDARAMGFAYRDSLLKRSMRGALPDDSRVWWPSPRYIALDVTLRLRRSPLSMPILWDELAHCLGVPPHGQAPLAAVREQVLALRAKRGTLVDGFGGAPAGNHDRWSVGSLFTNPIVDAARAAQLPPDMPRFPLGEHEVGGADATEFQVPAAWLIEHAGFGKGFGLHGAASRATVSGLHTLALTNRGGATAADIVELARAIQAGVSAKFHLDLVPEPNLIGVDI